jgi:fido (protein-threonine AMPylation protein)
MDPVVIQGIIDTVYDRVMAALTNDSIDVEQIEEMPMGEGTMSLSLSPSYELKKSTLYDSVEQILNRAVLTEEQELSQAQQEHARENINTLDGTTEEEFNEIFN